MEAIQNLIHYNWFVVVSAIIAAMIAFKFLCELFGWFIKKFGLETRGQREKREDKEKLDATTKLAEQTAKNLSKLETQHTKDEKEFRENLNRHMTESEKDRKALHQEMKQYSENRVKDREQSMQIQKELTSSMDKLAQLLLDKQISDYRWEIINVADKISNGRIVSKECLKHAIGTYDKYEKIIEEYGLVNGEVTVSIGVIKQEYTKVLSDEK